MINSASNIASSALNYASRALETSASNIANAQTVGQATKNDENGTAYVARRAEAISQSEGGVKTTIQPKAPGSVADEAVTQKFASYQFDASLKVIAVEDELTGNLLDTIA